MRRGKAQGVARIEADRQRGVEMAKGTTGDRWRVRK